MKQKIYPLLLANGERQKITLVVVNEPEEHELRVMGWKVGIIKFSK